MRQVINKLALIESNNPYLIKIKRKITEPINDKSNTDCEANKILKTEPKLKIILPDEINKENIYYNNKISKYLKETNNQLINSLAHALACTFFVDTVFKLFVNMSFYGIKCMVIKKRNYDLEYNNPHCLLEWEELYSESKNEFDIVYFIYDTTKGIINFIDPNKNIKEVASEVILDKGNRFHINSCIHIFRDFYIKKHSNSEQ